MTLLRGGEKGTGSKECLITPLPGIPTGINPNQPSLHDGFLKISSCIHAWRILITSMRQFSKDSILTFPFY